MSGGWSFFKTCKKRRSRGRSRKSRGGSNTRRGGVAMPKGVMGGYGGRRL